MNYLAFLKTFLKEKKNYFLNYSILAGNNLVAGGALIAAAASPLWAGLLVGKKRKRRSETSAHLNEIPVDQKPLNWHAKMIQNYIQQQGELYRKRQ